MVKVLACCLIIYLLVLIDLPAFQDLNDNFGVHSFIVTEPAVKVLTVL